VIERLVPIGGKLELITDRVDFGNGWRTAGASLFGFAIRRTASINWESLRFQRRLSAVCLYQGVIYDNDDNGFRKQDGSVIRLPGGNSRSLLNGSDSQTSSSAIYSNVCCHRDESGGNHGPAVAHIGYIHDVRPTRYGDDFVQMPSPKR
jgi:hypothetical protein